MNTLKKILIFLLFITVSSGQRNGKLSTIDSRDKHCHKGQCPTWFCMVHVMLVSVEMVII